VLGALQENVIARKSTIIMFIINTTAIDCKLVFNMIHYKKIIKKTFKNKKT